MIKALTALAAVALLLTGAWIVADLWADWRLDRAERNFVASVGPLDPEAYRPRPEEPGSPAGELLRGALDRYEVSTDDDGRLGELVRRPPAGWSDEDRRFVGRLVSDHAEVLALLRRTAPELPRAPFPDLTGLEADTADGGSDLLDLLRASKLLLGRAGLGLLEGEPREAASDLVVLGGLADAVGRQPELVYVLVGQAVESLYLRGARWAAADPGTPAAALESILAAMSPQPAGKRYSAAMARTAAQYATLIEREEIPLGRLERLAPWLRDLEQSSILDASRRMAEASGDPLSLADTAEEMRGERSIGAIVTSLLIPNMVDSLYKARALDASRQVARLALELRLHREGPSTGAGGPAGRAVGSRSPGVEVRVREDGSLVLSDPEARAAWEERWGHLEHAVPPPYVWELPARDAAVAML